MTQIIHCEYCEYVDSVSEEYPAGKLNADTQVVIETHLSTCQDCQNELDFALEIGDIMKEMSKPEPPPEVFNQVAAYVQSHPQSTV